jgi:type III pantothenate kinase
MLIAIDIGNSSVNIGFFTSDGLFVQKIDTYPLLSSRGYLALINRFIREKNIDKTPEGIIISSVVPDHTRVLQKTAEGLKTGGVMILSYRTRTGLTFDVRNPGKVGADRIADAVAAYELCKGPVAVANFGTATTVSVVGEGAVFLGGAIMPGIRLMNESLARGTSMLFQVPVRKTGPALGKDTTANIQSGLFYGTAGAVEKIIGAIEKESGFKLKVVVTGGYGALVSNLLKRKHKLKPYLTLEGLEIIYKRNTDA